MSDKEAPRDGLDEFQNAADLVGDLFLGFVKQLKVRRAERLQEEATKAKESAT